jgi:PAS domain S-box-containing protein
VAQHMERIARNSEDRLEIEYRFKTKDGRWIWCLSRDSAFARDEDGLVSQLIGTFFDITDRKRAEERLHRSELQYRDLFATLTQGVVFQVPPDGRIVDANPAAEHLLGLSRAEMLGRLPKDPAWQIINEDAREQNVDENPAMIALRTGQIVRGKILGVYHPQQKAHRWLHVDAVPQFRSGEAQPYMVCVLFTDITDRRIYEEEVRRINRELEQRVKYRTAEIEAQYKELEELNTIITQLARKTIEAMESDRQALAKEIHDSIAGTLAAIKMQLEAHCSSPEQGLSSRLMPLEKVVAHLAEAIKETRSISWQLRSPTLDDFGLEPALLEHVQHFREWYPGMAVDSKIEITGESIPFNIQTVVYRVFQEALNNVGKHSAATSVRFELTSRENQLWLELADNGCGFDPQTVRPGADSLTGYGIHSMRERVEICKGKFEILSEPGKGTKIKISIPL